MRARGSSAGEDVKMFTSYHSMFFRGDGGDAASNTTVFRGHFKTESPSLRAASRRGGHYAEPTEGADINRVCSVSADGAPRLLGACSKCERRKLELSSAVTIYIYFFVFCVAYLFVAWKKNVDTPGIRRHTSTHNKKYVWVRWRFIFLIFRKTYDSMPPW